MVFTDSGGVCHAHIKYGECKRRQTCPYSHPPLNAMASQSAPMYYPQDAAAYGYQQMPGPVCKFGSSCKYGPGQCAYFHPEAMAYADSMYQAQVQAQQQAQVQMMMGMGMSMGYTGGYAYHQDPALQHSHNLARGEDMVVSEASEQAALVEVLDYDEQPQLQSPIPGTHHDPEIVGREPVPTSVNERKKTGGSAYPNVQQGSEGNDTSHPEQRYTQNEGIASQRNQRQGDTTHTLVQPKQSPRRGGSRGNNGSAQEDRMSDENGGMSVEQKQQRRTHQSTHRQEDGQRQGRKDREETRHPRPEQAHESREKYQHKPGPDQWERRSSGRSVGPTRRLDYWTRDQHWHRHKSTSSDTHGGGGNWKLANRQTPKHSRGGSGVGQRSGSEPVVLTEENSNTSKSESGSVNGTHDRSTPPPSSSRASPKQPPQEGKDDVLAAEEKDRAIMAAQEAEREKARRAKGSKFASPLHSSRGSSRGGNRSRGR